MSIENIYLSSIYYIQLTGMNLEIYSLILNPTPHLNNITFLCYSNNWHE